MGNKRPSQVSRLLPYLLEGNSINQDEAKEMFGINRLASRICDIKELGYLVSKKRRTVLNRFG